MKSDDRTCNPADAVLAEPERKAPNSTVGYQCDALRECNIPTVADLM